MRHRKSEILPAFAAPGRQHVAATWASGSVALIVASLLLEVHQPQLGIKLGNIAFVLVCCLVIRARLPADARPICLHGLDDVLMACYLAWASFSATYSPAPSETIVQVAYAGMIWLAVLAVRTEPLHHTLHVIFAVIAFVSLLSIILLVAWPDLALQPQSSTGRDELRGIFEHQLRLGMLTGMGLGLLVLAVANGDMPSLRGGMPLLMLLLAIGAILVAWQFSQARSPTAALFLALLTCTVLTAPRGWVKLVAFVVLVGGLFLMVRFSEQLIAAILTTESDMTFSGRVEIWKETAEAAAWQHWTGYGFASFASPAFDRLWVHYRPPSAHNSLLQSYFETGVIGTSFLAVFVLLLIARGIYLSARLKTMSYSLFLVLYGVFCSLMSVIYGGKLSIMMTMILLVSAQEAHAARRLSTLGSSVPNSLIPTVGPGGMTRAGGRT